MAIEGLDMRELINYGRKLRELGDKKMTKELKKHMRKEGTKLKKLTKKEAKKVKKRTGNYHKSIKRGKIYKKNGDIAIRVYSSAPHAHLIEDGHRQVTKDGREVGFVQGKHIFRDSQNQFSNEFEADTQEFINNLTSDL